MDVSSDDAVEKSSSLLDAKTKQWDTGAVRSTDDDEAAAPWTVYPAEKTIAWGGQLRGRAIPTAAGKRLHARCLGSAPSDIRGRHGVRGPEAALVHSPIPALFNFSGILPASSTPPRRL